MKDSKKNKYNEKDYKNKKENNNNLSNKIVNNSINNISDLLSYTYKECVRYLLSKYGNVPKDYFRNENCKSKSNGITRTKDGLYIHHIDEDKAILLSHRFFALKHPFDYQRADRLVYCDLLEHLILHIKIWEENPFEQVGIGGITCFLIPELNDIYSGIEYKIPWKQNTSKKVIPLKNEYLKCIKYLVDKKFNEPLMTSLDHNSNIWDKSNNSKLFDEFKKLGVTR